MSEPYVRVVSLWIHPGQEAAFAAFEREAVMGRYGGRVDRAVRVVGGGGDSPFEIHVLVFPDRDAAESCATDAETERLRDRRARVIMRTEVQEGRFAGPYLAA
jgi:hypothetical protein